MSSGYSRGVIEDLALPRLDDVEVAARCIEGKAHQTAVLTCEALDTRAGAELFFKCENLRSWTVYYLNHHVS